MRKWVIVEDRPWVVGGFILEVKRMMENETEKFSGPEVLYYIAGRSDDERQARKKKYEKYVQEFRNKTGLDVREIYEDSFDDCLDQYYSDDEYIIFMDLNLTGESSAYFHERQNVRYVFKRCGNKKQRRIWFYTTGASLDSGFLYEYFPNNTLEVESFTEGNAHFNMDQVRGILDRK